MGFLFMLYLCVNMDFNIKLGLIILYKLVKIFLWRKKIFLNYNFLFDVIVFRNFIIMFIFNEVLIFFISYEIVIKERGKGRYNIKNNKME